MMDTYQDDNDSDTDSQLFDDHSYSHKDWTIFIINNQYKLNRFKRILDHDPIGKIRKTDVSRAFALWSKRYPLGKLMIMMMMIIIVIIIIVIIIII